MLSKKVIASLVASGLMASGVVAMSFSGEQTLQDAMNRLNETTGILNVFKSNELTLADRIETLKVSKQELFEQVIALTDENGVLNDKQKELLAQIDTLEQTIKDLEEQLANGNGSNGELETENNRLNVELNKANNEIDKANKLVGQLQTQLDNMKIPNPISEKELNDLLSDEVGDNGGDNGGTETPQPPFTDEELASANAVFENGAGFYSWQSEFPSIENYVDLVKINEVSYKIEVNSFENDLITVEHTNGKVFTENGIYASTSSDRPSKITISHKDGTKTVVLVKY